MASNQKGNQTHLILSDRIYIEQGLERGLSFKDVAAFIGITAPRRICAMPAIVEMDRVENVRKDTATQIAVSTRLPLAGGE